MDEQRIALFWTVSKLHRAEFPRLCGSREHTTGVATPEFSRAVESRTGKGLWSRMRFYAILFQNFDTGSV